MPSPKLDMRATPPKRRRRWRQHDPGCSSGMFITYALLQAEQSVIFQHSIETQPVFPLSSKNLLLECAIASVKLM